MTRKGGNRDSDAMQLLRNCREQAEDVFFITGRNAHPPDEERCDGDRGDDGRRDDSFAKDECADAEEDERERQPFAFRQYEERKPKSEADFAV